MKKVLFLSAVILSVLVGCKKNELVEKPVDESPAQIVEPVQANVELSDEQKEEQRIEEIMNDSSLDVYQKMDAIGYQSDDILKFNYRNNSSDLSSWREREIKYDMNDKKLTKEKLMSTVWTLNKSILDSFVLIFYSNNFFSIGEKNSGPSAFGTYDIEGEVLFTKSFCYDPKIDFYEKIASKDIIASYIEYVTRDYYYRNDLKLNGIQFFPEGSQGLKENGEYAFLDGYTVDVIKSMKVMSENVKFHTKPSADSKTQNVEM